MPRDISGFGLGAIGVGGIFIYGAIKGVSILQAARAVVTGQDPTTLTNANPITSGVTGPPSDATAGGATGEHSGGGDPTQAKAIGRMLASKRGWDGAEFNALDALWTRESGWSNTADTRKSHAGGDDASTPGFAYGVAQARPYYKMPKAGWPPDKGGSADITVQEQWGMDYIAGRYGTPSVALEHENANGWY